MNDGVPIQLLIGLMLAAVSMAGVAEYWLHRRRLAGIRVRVHVNGTRGKSSVTRLVAAGLRAGGLRTCAKTTGTLPRFIMPDGSEFPVFRPARTNIIEQLRIVSAAAANGAEALVIECMALQPYLQWLSEARMLRATHGVITNARADHLDVMGPTEPDVALALAGMVPHGGALITSEQRHMQVFRAAAADRRSRLVEVTEPDVARVTDAELAGFSYIEHAENLALALQVCAELGVERGVALAGMWAARPDPGVMLDYELDFFGRRLVLVNAFAANDPESTERLWRMAIERHPELTRRVAVFNCRADRGDRSRQLAVALAGWPPARRVVLIGSGTHLFARAAVKAGVDAASLVSADGADVNEVFETILEQAGRQALVVGMGNIAGPGMSLVRLFRNRSKLRPAKEDR